MKSQQDREFDKLCKQLRGQLIKPEGVISAARRKYINTPELKVRYINFLYEVVGRSLPKNKAGTPLVSDFDLVNATPEQQVEALLKTLGRWFG